MRRTPREDLLVGALDDWADAGWTVHSARLGGANDPFALRDAALALIGEVLHEGLMVAGDVLADEHNPWQCSTEEAVDRIRREWLDEWCDDVPSPGAVVWLANTPAGDEVGRAVLARESEG
jgi:hypothetical protein